MDEEKTKSADIKLDSSTSPANNISHRNSLPDQLHKVISNLYLNAPARLCLRFRAKCSDDLSFCQQNHFRADFPNAPTHSQAIGLRGAFQQERYMTFISVADKMCLRKVFPGTGIFTRLTELLLVCRIFILFSTKRSKIIYEN